MKYPSEVQILINKDFENITVVELKQRCKELGIKNISKLKKSELIGEINKTSQVSMQKDGVILREKISPKISSTVEENVIDKSEKHVEINSAPITKPTSNENIDKIGRAHV